MAGKTARHYPLDHLKDDGLEELRAPLSKALDLSDEDFDRLSPEVKNLLSATTCPSPCTGVRINRPMRSSVEA